MGYTIWWLAASIRHTGEPGATSQFTGTEADALWVFWALGTVVALCAAMTVVGIWHIIYGRRHSGMMRLLLLLVALILLAAAVGIGWTSTEGLRQWLGPLPEWVR